jgi:hypothetical protein
MTIKEIEAHFTALSGDQLLHELSVFTAMHYDAHVNQEEDHMEAIVRVIQTRLAETGIAQMRHGKDCRFTAGEDRCPCPIAAWTWPRKGLPSEMKGSR